MSGLLTGPPRIVIAAPASRSGKTTVATGLMAALAARGLRVSGHKVGPDYIDPGYHALATGRPGRNLDPWLTGEERVVPLFLHGAHGGHGGHGADVAVVEGVMGLFDGAARPAPADQPTGRQGGPFRSAFGSTAHVAALLRAPVLLVADASAQGRSIAALVHGFASYDPSVQLAGVVLNRVGSDRHEAILREALAGLGVPVLGALRRRADLATPSRHLGLVPAAERAAEAKAMVRAAGAAIGAAVDLDAVLALARAAPPLTGEPWDPAREAGWDVAGRDADRPLSGTAGRPASGMTEAARRVGTPARESSPLVTGSRGERVVVAVARGPAFTFGYAETAELLTAAGADVVAVDPLRDEALPPGVRGLVVGGGFPEVYAAALSANEPLRAAVAALARSGAPVAAECAGLLYLARSLDGSPMCGVIDTDAHMTDRLTLGYREAVAVTDSVVGRAGEPARGHEFHRTTCTPPAGTASGGAATAGTATGGAPAWRWDSPDGDTVEGFVRDGVHASYLHTHWAGHPQAARRFVAACT